MPENTYMFGNRNTDLETQRLDELEALLDENTFDRLDRLGIGRGDRCLEVGAGRGTTALFMLSRCGAAGEVVGIDVDTRWLDSIQHPNFRAVDRDVVQGGWEDLGTFDVVHTRFLLHHLGRERGARVASQLAELLAPGGRILIEEPMSTGRADPGHPARDTFESIARHWYGFVADAVGLDVDFGLTLPRLLTGAGLIDVGNDVRGVLSTVGDRFNQWMNTSATSARTAMEAAFDDGGAAFRSVVNEPGLWSTAWLVVAAWGTRSA